MSRHDSQPNREVQPGQSKPSVPLEKMIDQQHHGSAADAADRLGSEAAKAPPPEVESPAGAEPLPEESVMELTENERRQRTE